MSLASVNFRKGEEEVDVIDEEDAGAYGNEPYAPLPGRNISSGISVLGLSEDNVGRGCETL